MVQLNMNYMPPNEHSNIWNSLPVEERERLMPYMIESQILHLWQAKQAMLKSHAQAVKEIDEWIENCKRSLASLKSRKDA